jgi:tetratricopeptide repeat protein
VSASTKKQENYEPDTRSPVVAPDEGSFPPVAEFGLQGERDDLDMSEEGDDPRAVERHRALMSPGAKKRRARFAKYVGGAMAASLVLCAAAVVKISAPSVSDPPPKMAFAAPTRLSPPPVSASSAPRVPAPVEASSAVAAVASEPPPTPVPAPKTVPSAAVQDAPPLSVAPSPPVGAIKERESSRFALERGDLGTAISAGEKSVALDPTDGEAWLVLGAAYQARGNLAQAKRCYRACIEQGTRGPKAECRAMSQAE